MHLEKINNAVVRPIVVEKDEREWKGADVMVGYPNTFICCRKNSGKTTLIHDILKRTCCKRQTRVFVFCASHDKDQNWIAIQQMLDDKGIPNEFYSSIHDVVDGKTAIDYVLEEVDSPPEEEEEEEEEPKILEEGQTIKIRKKRKPKKLAPRSVVVFDDVSSELSNKKIGAFFKRNRHSKCRTICSSQYVHDLTPSARTQIDLFLLGKGICPEKLKHVYKYAEPPMSEEDFYEMYWFATRQPYKFLYMHPTREDYRVNFDQRVHLT